MIRLAVLPAFLIRSFSLAASLIAAMTLATTAPALASEDDVITPLTGEEIAQHIHALLAENDISGTAQLNLKEKHNPCPVPITVAPLFKNWKTIKVTCPANTQWRLLVRVELDDEKIAPARNTAISSSPEKTGRAAGTPRALALKRSMAKGEVILEDDVLMVPISARQGYGVFLDAGDVIGRRVRTPISAHAPIKSRQLEPKYLVEEKKPVIIAINTGGIYVEMSGISLQNGQLGEAVKVENISSGKTITGKVTGLRKISPMH